MSPRLPILGVLMLETRFPRLLGDIGNPATFAGPVRYAVVRGATPVRVVHGGDDRALLQPFIDAALRLVDEGATLISTSCGFLVRFQAELQAAVPVPVWSSSLLLVPALQAALPAGKSVGIVTVDGGALSAGVLAAAGAAGSTPVEGLTAGCDFQRALLEDVPAFDIDAARGATVDAALRLVARRPDVAVLVLECTNMPPYAQAVRHATGRPVHDIVSGLASRSLAPSPPHRQTPADTSFADCRKPRR